MHATDRDADAPVTAPTLDALVETLTAALDRAVAARFGRAVVRTYVRMVDDAALATVLHGSPPPDGPGTWGRALAGTGGSWRTPPVVFWISPDPHGWVARREGADGHTDGRVAIVLKLTADAPPPPVDPDAALASFAPSAAERARRMRARLTEQGEPSDDAAMAGLVGEMPSPTRRTPRAEPAAATGGEVRRFDVVVGRDRRVWIAVDEVGFSPEVPIRLTVTGDAVSFVQGVRVYGTVAGCSGRSVDVLTSRSGGTVDLVEIPVERERVPRHHVVEVDAVSTDAPLIVPYGGTRVVDGPGRLAEIVASGRLERDDDAREGAAS